MGNALTTQSVSPKSLKSPPSQATNPRRTFTPEELEAYDGKTKNPIYISLLSEVYDVSADASKYGPNGSDQALTGRDASRALATGCMDQAGNLDLSDLTDEQKETLAHWVIVFTQERKYPSVGRLILHQDLTREELRQFNGVDNPRCTVLVGLNGDIYDVTANGLMHYGPDGAYQQFAGRDASRALACMSFDPDCIENPSIEELTPPQREALADWAGKFKQKYPIVGKVL